MNSSFMSEKSAELILVPKLVSILSQNFKTVIPIHFWATREGNNLSRKCDDNKELLIFAMYARRPKIEIPSQPTILVKINAELFSYAQYLGMNGIPVIAGVPSVSSLMDIDQTHCLWLEIDNNNEDLADIYYEISLEQNKIIKCKSFYGMKNLLDDNDIIKIIRENSRPMTWNNVIDIIRGLGKRIEIQLRGNTRFSIPWFGVYKPIYFLLRN